MRVLKKHVIRQYFLCTVLIVLMVSACRQGPQKDTLFTLIPSEQSGVKFSNDLEETTEFNILEYLYFYDGAGVAVGDINNDGLSDLFFTANQKKNKLYLNKGNFVFEDISSSSGIDAFGGWSIGAVMADVNGDGYLDIYVSQLGNYKGIYGENRLYINDGGEGTSFTEKAREYGLYHNGYSTQASFFDYDNDGDLDMYLLNHSAHGPQNFGSHTLRYSYDSLAGDKLFRNDLNEKEGRFVDVTKFAGIFSSSIGYGLGITATDIDLDGWTDIFISNDFHENDYIYMNNRDGTFTDKLEEFFTHTSLASMGNDVADFNNDGLPDIFILEMMPDDDRILKKSMVEDPEVNEIVTQFGYFNQVARNTLQLNRGKNLFSDIAMLSGVHASDWSWASLFCDLDNDGYKDLFVTNGIYKRPNDVDFMDFQHQFLMDNLRGKSRQEITEFLSDKSSLNAIFLKKLPTNPITNKAYRNNGDLTFTDKAVSWGLKERFFSNGAAYADLDNDGDLDLVMNNINDEAGIYRNNSETLLENSFLQLRLRSERMNTHAIGTKVLLYSSSGMQYQELMPVRGFQSSVDPIIHFGLGQDDIVDSLKIIWPDHTSQTLRNVNANQILTIDQKYADLTQQKEAPTFYNIKSTITKKLFSTPVEPTGIEFKHRENDFNDFDYQFLMPQQLSALGPRIAVGDVNNDGYEDLYVGGARGQPGQIFLQSVTGQFAQIYVDAFVKDSVYEDVDAAFFDANGDGAQDLYVVSGGNEYRESNEHLQDRLYLNDGKGIFVRAVSALPENFRANGSCVAAEDFDRDGDMDLFVGTRCLINNYGFDPLNYLFENDGEGRFENVITEVAPDFPNGMVTDAVWSDINQDGQEDLIVVGDWMPVMVFINENGLLENRTENAGLIDTFGWWNCIFPADLDSDGDPDFIIGNHGSNSKLKASLDKPLTMYVGDFDSNGQIEQILCTRQGVHDVPFPMLDELRKQIPGIAKVIPDYTTYSMIDGIEDLLNKSQLRKAHLQKTCILTSSWLENKDNGNFELHPLPIEAQFSPVYGIVAKDMDGDNITDLIIGGNFNGASINYGPYDAGLCLVLKGKGNGSFQPLEPLESGIAVRGEVRDLAVIKKTNGDYLLLISRNNDTLLSYQAIQ